MDTHSHQETAGVPQWLSASTFQQLSPQQRQGCVLVTLSTLLLGVLGIISLSMSSPASPPLPPTPAYPPLTGRALITTLGTHNTSECLWNRPGPQDIYQAPLACRAHGAPVEILQSTWIAEAGQPGCYAYLVRTLDGRDIGGWVSGFVLTQDLNQPPREYCPWQPTPTPPPQA